MATAKKQKDQPTIIKKYANRRLYDTGRSSYVTLDDLCELVKEGHDFVVVDAKSGEDLTKSVLTQIIVDQESRGENMLPQSFLRHLIGLYGGEGQPAFPNYLEQAMEFFIKNQESFAQQVNQTLEASRKNMKNFENAFPAVPAIEQMQRQNMAMFEKAMGMFSPFGSNSDKDTDK